MHCIKNTLILPNLADLCLLLELHGGGYATNVATLSTLHTNIIRFFNSFTQSSIKDKPKSHILTPNILMLLYQLEFSIITNEEFDNNEYMKEFHIKK